jgi:hypothetical protein
MKLIITFFLLSFSTLIYGQGVKTSDFKTQIKGYDISDLLTLEQFDAENGYSTVKRMEPIGYIGDNFQRFYIHFISVIQNPNNPLEYLVYGKTKVKENVSSFQGTLTIMDAQTYDEGDIPTLKQGFIKGQYKFFEDPHQYGTGILNGEFQTNFYISEQVEIKYDALMFFADGFYNNQFQGTWTSYKTKKSKICNWGDYRIPDSGDLDIGAGGFRANDKYFNLGWKTYEVSKGYGTNATKEEIEEARKSEQKKWWREK